ncbi:helix-turn-helix domain-containing protein [Niallia taxi]|uniref:helix-turn-helix domain-containing protein n=1 Tax=Niallia taxi TaxID=2499688 RepID=UPI0015F778D1|nr:helix-turn-helix domain-containing protein [Niallia taxi]
MTTDAMTQDQEEVIYEDVTTKELAELADITEQTVYSLVKRGEITPVNKEDWTIDGTYYFDAATVNKVKEMYRKPGLTNKDVAEELQVSLSTAQKLIKSREIPSFTAFYLGKNVSFVKVEDLKVFMESHQFERKTPIFHKGTNTFLFQSFVHSDTGEFARITEITNEGKISALTERGTVLSLETLLEKGYSPSVELTDKKVNNKRGYCLFQFVKPSQLQSPIYDVLELLFQQVGPNNLKVKVEETKIEVSVKPALLPLNKEEHKTIIELLQHNCSEGKVSVRHKGVMVDSDLETIHTVIPSDLKKKVNQVVENETDMTIEDFVKLAIEKELKARGMM